MIHLLVPLGILLLFFACVTRIWSNQEFERTRLPTIDLNFQYALCFVGGVTSLIIWFIVYFEVGP